MHASPFEIVAVLITFAAGASYINYRFLRLPQTIGLMTVALVAALLLMLLGHLEIVPTRDFSAFVESLNFSRLLLHGILSFLLFAGALHVDISDLRRARFSVGLLASVGVVISTFVTGGLFWYVAKLAGLQLGAIHALLFGALISPTDPVAVLAIIRRAGAPKALETRIVGESLFNDGVGIVIFSTLFAIALHAGSPTPISIASYFLREALGGIALGLVLGWLCSRLLEPLDAYRVEILLTLAFAAAGYALAERLVVSGPLTVVVAGLVVGNHGRKHAMSPRTRQHLDEFWELVDAFLNAILFALIGLEVVAIALPPKYLLAGLLAIPIVLVARLVSVAVPILALKPWRPFDPGTVPALTWGGLRGGVSIALALSLPNDSWRSLLVTTTYVVAIFSMLGQGLSVGRLIRYLGRT